MLNFKIYQINGDRDENRMSFMRYDSLEKFQGSKDVNSSIYDKVYEGSIDGSSLEDIYKTFNYNHPEDFKGHSLSVSDIVEIISAPKIVGKIDYLKSGMSSVYTDFLKYTQEQERLREKDVDFEAHDYVGLNVPVIEKGFYFCDSFGFKKVDFDPEKTKDAFTKEMMKVLFLEPGKVAKVVEIENTLAAKQQLVGGRISKLDPFNEDVCIICNDEGKNIGLPLNRAVFDEREGAEHEMIDIIAGPCFLCDCSGENFGSLSDDQISRYEEKFRLPEHFYRMNGKIVNKAYNPITKEPSLNEKIQSASSRVGESMSAENSRDTEFDR